MKSSTKPDPDFPVGSAPAWTECSGELPDDRPPEPERYVGGGELGRGGMGVVTAATDAWLDREVAVKRPLPDLPEASRARLVREARLTARLAHPGIVPIHDLGSDEQGAYYTMPVLTGRTYAEAAADAARPLPTLVRLLASACRAVAFAHSRGVVHRDLKPHNILLGDFGEVRVLDWGVALDPAAPDSATVGTPGWRAPEQEAGVVVGPPADVYALGLILGQVLDDRGAEEPELAAIVSRCRQDPPDARYVDAGSLADELDRWLDGRRVLAHEYSPAELLRRTLWSWRWPAAAAAGLGTATVLVAIGWTWTLTQERDRALAAEATADEALAVSLWQQAEAHRSRDEHPIARALAARSLKLSPTPEARGIWMGSSGVDHPQLQERIELPCRGFASDDGTGLVCAPDSGEISFWQDGELRWTAAATPPEGALDFGVGYRDGRVFDDRALLVRDPNTVELWTQGQRVGAWTALRLNLASGPVPAVYDHDRVGRLAGGTLVWSDALCSGRIEDAWVDEQRTAVICVGEVAVSSGEAIERIELPSEGSAVAWTPSGLVVGTFDGGLLARTADGWRRTEAGVSAPVELTPVGDRLLVRGERGQPRVWLPATGAFVGRLDGQPWRLGTHNGEALLFTGTHVERHSLPARMAPVRIDRLESGGLGFATLDDDGATALVGHANGDVELWRLGDGHRELLQLGCGNVAKSGAFVGGEPVASQLGCGVRTLPSDGPEDVGAVRTLVAAGDGYIAASYGAHVWGVSGGQKQRWELPTAPVDVAWDGDRRWALTAAGLVYTLRDEAELRFEAPGATRLSATPDAVYVLRGTSVERRTSEGEVVWAWTSDEPLTAIHSNHRWVALGDLRGRVHVLDTGGHLLATVQGHDRRVSSVDMHRTVLISASWDGSLRRWGLGEL